ncbi:MAG TPA: SDR family oxidoreductase [Solirubrobacteraceae bacterium]|jgi:NAD(P)-dependent dehydrogenase (short-subunit alcohol dehydrogenase family)|nr:SDR family oxidoreductase [Solirubrobacteraceae bacterium]
MGQSPDFVVKDLDELGVAITGGSSGIGLAAAERLATAGVPRILLIGRNPGRGAAAVARVKAREPSVAIEFLSADCNDPDTAAEAIEHAEEVLQGVDLLINATAATFVPDLIYDISPSDIPLILAEQALAPLLTTRLVLPHMRARRGGAIINIASDAAKVPTPGESMIGAAMAAIVTFSRTIAMEAKRDGIRVNILTPSLVTGTATAERIFQEGFSQKLFQKAGSQAHLGISVPEDQAELILYLASPQAARLTGQAISLNGGISAA